MNLDQPNLDSTTFISELAEQGQDGIQIQALFHGSIAQPYLAT